MGKILNPYTLCSATSIINRSSDIGDEAEDSGNVDVTNITMTDIRNGMAGSSNSLYDLHSDNNVNRWSYFGPYAHSISQNEIVATLKSPARMGDFAGYDHNAFAPYIELDAGSTTETDYWKGEPGCANNAHIILNMHLAEIDFKALAGNSGKLLAEMVDDGDPNNTHSFSIEDYENDSTFMTMTTERDVNSQQGFTGSITGADYTIRLKSLTAGDVLSAYVGGPINVTVTETIYTPYVCVPNDECHPDSDPTQNMLTLDTEDVNVDIYYFRRNCSSGDPKSFYVSWKTVTVRDYQGNQLTGYNDTVEFNIKWWPTDQDEQNDTNAVFESIFSQEVSGGEFDWGSIQTKEFSTIDLEQRNRVVVYWYIP